MVIGTCPMNSGFGGYLGMGYGWIFQIIIFVIFFIVVWWLLKNNNVIKNESNQKESPLDILKRRLAKGELNKKEYEELKKEIE